MIVTTPFVSGTANPFHRDVTLVRCLVVYGNLLFALPLRTAMLSSKQASLELSDKCLNQWIRANPHGIVDPVRGSENRGFAYRLRGTVNVFAVFTSHGLTVGFSSHFDILG